MQEKSEEVQNLINSYTESAKLLKKRQFEMLSFRPKQMKKKWVRKDKFGKLKKTLDVLYFDMKEKEKKYKLRVYCKQFFFLLNFHRG